MSASLALLAYSSVLVGTIALLFAWRRIPRAAAPDDIIQLRSDFESLSDMFRVFVEQHDEEMGRHHAKVAYLRRKLRKYQEDDDDYDEEEIEVEPAPALPEPAQPLAYNRSQAKAALRQHLRQKQGEVHGTVQRP